MDIKWKNILLSHPETFERQISREHLSEYNIKVKRIASCLKKIKEKWNFSIFIEKEKVTLPLELVFYFQK